MVVWKRCGGGASRGARVGMVQGGCDGGAGGFDFKARGRGRADQIGATAGSWGCPGNGWCRGGAKGSCGVA